MFQPQLQALVDLAENAAKEYFESGQSSMSDEEYDSIRRLIIEQCKLNGVNPNSIKIISQVGFPAKENKLKHIVRMYSLDNLYDSVNLAKFLKSIHSKLNSLSVVDEPIRYGLEYKMDGMALDLTYRHGKLVSAITRGDGFYGENILTNILCVDSIPKTLMLRDECIDVPLLVIHGELYAKKSELERYTSSPECPIHQPPQSCRALVASIRSKDFKAKGIRLSFNPHEIAALEMNPVDAPLNYPEELLSDSMYERLGSLEQLGFTRSSPLCPPVWADNVRHLLETIEIRYSRALDTRAEFDHPIDGIVLSVDNIEYRSILGHTARVPRWAMAYKFPALGVQTSIRQIVWQITATGNLIPVLKVDPVSLSGITISSVSMFSVQTLLSRALHHFDKVTVVRKADVTPFLSEVHPEFRQEGSTQIKPPDSCPSCKAPLRNSGVHLTCLNAVCPAQLTARLVRFVGSAGMNIRAFGKYGVESLFSQGLLQVPSDIYFLHEKNKIQSKSWQELVAAIESSKQQDFLIVLKALMAPKPKGGYMTIVKAHRDLFSWLNDVINNPKQHEQVICDWVRDNSYDLFRLHHVGVGHVNTAYEE